MDSSRSGSNWTSGPSHLRLLKTTVFLPKTVSPNCSRSLPFDNMPTNLTILFRMSERASFHISYLNYVRRWSIQASRNENLRVKSRFETYLEKTWDVSM